eukprot:Opistho-1_new@87869
MRQLAAAPGDRPARPGAVRHRRGPGRRRGRRPVRGARGPRRPVRLGRRRLGRGVRPGPPRHPALRPRPRLRLWPGAQPDGGGGARLARRGALDGHWRGPDRRLGRGLGCPDPHRQSEAGRDVRPDCSRRRKTVLDEGVRAPFLRRARTRPSRGRKGLARQPPQEAGRIVGRAVDHDAGDLAADRLDFVPQHQGLAGRPALGRDHQDRGVDIGGQGDRHVVAIRGRRINDHRIGMFAQGVPVAGVADRLGPLARTQMLGREPGDPQPPAEAGPGRHQPGRMHGLAGPVHDPRRHRKEDRAVGRGDGRLAERAETVGLGRDRFHLTLLGQVGVDQPDGTAGAHGGKAGVFARDRGHALARGRGGDLDHAAAMARRRSQRGPESRHFGCQIDHRIATRPLQAPTLTRARSSGLHRGHGQDRHVEGPTGRGRGHIAPPREHPQQADAQGGEAGEQEDRRQQGRLQAGPLGRCLGAFDDIDVVGPGGDQGAVGAGRALALLEVAHQGGQDLAIAGQIGVGGFQPGHLGLPRAQLVQLAFGHGQPGGQAVAVGGGGDPGRLDLGEDGAGPGADLLGPDRGAGGH